MNQPSYYAIIPADVRYDKELKANEKLLYGELTCLSNKYGYCFASNAYFAELYGVSDRTIRDWLANLEKYGYIRRELNHIDSQNVERKIYILNKAEKIDREEENFLPPREENILYNNTRYLILQGMGEFPQAPQEEPVARKFQF